MSYFDKKLTKTAKGRKPPLTWLHIRQGLLFLYRQSMALIGLLLLIISFPIGILSPFIPIGLPIAIVGASLLVRYSKWGAYLVKTILERNPKLTKLMPAWLLKLIGGDQVNMKP